MVTEVTRYIKPAVERDLWARAAGRCQFSGCNKLLYKSAVTQESVNLAQKAHIYSFSENGPRGRGPFDQDSTGLNGMSNLMLMCHGCHQKIDRDKNGERYSAELLKIWKEDHERRVEIVTAIEPDKKTHIVLYGANIGSEKSPINYISCVKSIFPSRYPANEKPVILSMNSELRDSSVSYWAAESAHLYRSFERNIVPLIGQDHCKHFSVFALAPQPLLINLGALLTDKISVETYQLHREPKGWRWEDEPVSFEFKILKPKKFNGTPALVFSLSAHVAHERITSVLDDANIWEITIQNPHNDFMKSKLQLTAFRRCVRQVMVDITNKHGTNTPLHIFPVMPVSCNVELGRARMPKADMPWVIYDQDSETNKFNKTVELRGEIHAR